MDDTDVILEAAVLQFHDLLAAATVQNDKTPEPAQQTAGTLADWEPATRKTDELVSLADAKEGIESRTRVRAKVNSSACVRTEAFGDDIVQCVDMSCGGVCFRSPHSYYKEMSMQIAVPFSAEAKMAQRFLCGGDELRTSKRGTKWCGAVAWNF